MLIYLENIGNQIRLARLRRKLSVELIAERVGVSRTTIWKVEKRDPSVAMGIYAKTLAALQLLGDIELLAKEDPLGHYIQDADIDKWRRKP